MLAVRDTVYRQAGLRRLEEARVLVDNAPSYPSGAIYLGGYAVECLFKWYICRTALGGGVRYLQDLGDQRRVARLLSARGHDLEMLAVDSGCWPAIRREPEIVRHFNNVSIWAARLRYHAGAGDERVARSFLSSVARLIRWLEGRAY